MQFAPVIFAERIRALKWNPLHVHSEINSTIFNETQFQVSRHKIAALATGSLSYPVITKNVLDTAVYYENQVLSA